MNYVFAGYRYLAFINGAGNRQSGVPGINWRDKWLDRKPETHIFICPVSQFFS
jgi:hypothetical protein